MAVLSETKLNIYFFKKTKCGVKQQNKHQKAFLKNYINKFVQKFQK